ncbi:MAG: ATP-grasp fold amidoligase family protein [Wenzhouxiangellaceae bacterium]
MISVAEKLARSFDFVRVDLYAIMERIYFGELTHYPGAGTSAFEPMSFDFDLGTHWQLRKNYWTT